MFLSASIRKPHSMKRFGSPSEDGRPPARLIVPTYPELSVAMSMLTICMYGGHDVEGAPVGSKQTPTTSPAEGCA